MSKEITERREVERLIKWERSRRFLRRHGLPVPAYMLPEKETPNANDHR